MKSMLWNAPLLVFCSLVEVVLKGIRRVVGDPESVAERMTLVLKAHRELDRQCHNQAKEAGL